MSVTLELLKSRLLGLDSRLFEDELYKIAWEEIERGQLDPASQARSIADGEGDNGKTRSAYIRHRVRRLSDELEILKIREQEKAKAKAKIARLCRILCVTRFLTSAPAFRQSRRRGRGHSCPH